MSVPAVSIDRLSKHFDLRTEPAKTVKERFLSIGRNASTLFTALDEVTFDVQQGETIGLLGHNGSGKSTLLKCIAGTIRPSSGTISVRGRMAAMLELGAGFHPDLSGRENVYLNGSILGFSKEHINSIFDDIVGFAELEPFIDAQVKHYSSGMYARLGFAVAVNLEPDVLLVDEVLSVGDEAFQRKCIERVRRLQTEGRTIVLVTHSADQVLQVCDRAAVLDHGRLVYVGETADGVQAFRRTIDGDHEIEVEPEEIAEVAETEGPVDLVGSARIVGVDIRGGSDDHTFAPHDPIEIALQYRTRGPVENVRARLILTTHDGVQMLSAATSDINGADIAVLDGEGEIVFTIERLPFLDSQLRVGLVLQDHLERFEYDRQHDVGTFYVESDQPPIGRVAVDLSVEHRSSDAVIS